MIRLAVVALLTLAVASGVARPAAGARIYAGQPMDRGEAQLVLALTNAGDRLARLTFHFDVTCEDEEFWTVDFGSVEMTPTAPATPLAGRHYLVGGGLTREGRLAATIVGVDGLGDGLVESMTADLTGNVDRGAAHGSLHVSYSRADAAGRVTSTCVKDIPWRAVRRPGRVFAGTTSQDEPIVLELRADRRRFSHAHVSWYGLCDSGGAWMDPHDEFSYRPFPLSRRGTFGRTFEVPFDGGLVTERFAGRIGRAVARGTFSGSLLALAPGGIETCASGAVTWTATTG